MSGAATAMPASPGRNQPCPCGSGRKFKLCCGAARSTPPETAGRQSASPALPTTSFENPPAAGVPGLGPLTEVSAVRAAAERFWRIQSGLAAPAIFSAAAPLDAGAVPRPRIMAAERHRQRGVRLVEAGRLAAGMSALSRAIRLNPRDAAAHHALGCALLDSGHLGEATESLSLATALDDTAAAHHDLAVALRRQHLNAEAMAAYRRAIELAPEFVEAHVSLAELLELADEREEAADCLRRAAAIAGETSGGRLYSAQALIIERDFTAAESRLRQAIALDPQNDELLKYLGNVFSFQGRFDEAIDAFDRSLALNPRRLVTHFNAVEARKCTEADRPRLAQLLALLGEGSLDDEGRLLLHFTVGKLLDDLGEYEGAMQHFDDGNRIRRQYASFEGAAFSGEIDRLIRRFTSDFFAANTAFGQDDETPLLIVGMPRSGTTLVEQIVSSHPAIAGGGELPFWVRQGAGSGTLDATYLTPQAGRELSRQYLALLRQIAPSAPRVTDKLPFNLLCLGLIHLLLPKARVILCRRHPVDVCLSIYFTHFLQTISFASDKADLVAAYREYARLMDHWRAVLPPDRFLEIEYEKLVADREAVTRRLIAFAGLEWDDSCLRPEHNRRPVVTASVWQARQPIYTSSLQRWRHYEPWLGELRQLLREDRTAPPPAGASG